MLKNEASVLALLGTLYANALRREQQGRYDVAALFLYRSLELMSQHRLAKEWDINTAKPKYTEARRKVPNFETQYEDIKQRIFPNNYGYGVLKKKSKISLFNGYMLLKALEDPLVKDYEVEIIQERTDARNNSMLAHGFDLITKEEYNQFYEVVEQVLQRFLQVCNQDQAAWVKECSFLTPFGETPMPNTATPSAHE